MRAHFLRAVFACAVIATASFHANSADYPCTGKKGGVSHCASEIFPLLSWAPNSVDFAARHGDFPWMDIVYKKFNMAFIVKAYFNYH